MRPRLCAGSWWSRYRQYTVYTCPRLCAGSWWSQYRQYTVYTCPRLCAGSWWSQYRQYIVYMRPRLCAGSWWCAATASTSSTRRWRCATRASGRRRSLSGRTTRRCTRCARATAPSRCSATSRSSTPSSQILAPRVRPHRVGAVAPVFALMEVQFF